MIIEWSVGLCHDEQEHKEFFSRHRCASARACDLARSFISRVKTFSPTGCHKCSNGLVVRFHVGSLHAE
jgi:hypothetical protein